MNINFHIERLVLDGLPLERRHGPYLQAAVERELTRLLTDRSSTAPLPTSRTLASVKGGSIQLTERADAAGLGKQIAAAVYGGLGGER
jgi:hypothetical protein